ncbi:MAG: hypothetical protein ACRC2M_21170, partial [Planktothrix sp.]
MPIPDIPELLKNLSSKLPPEVLSNIFNNFELISEIEALKEQITLKFDEEKAAFLITNLNNSLTRIDFNNNIPVEKLPEELENDRIQVTHVNQLDQYPRLMEYDASFRGSYN